MRLGAPAAVRPRCGQRKLPVLLRREGRVLKNRKGVVLLPGRALDVETI